MTRQENEFTAAQVARYPERLVAFLPVDPLAESAIDEILHWRGSHQLIGLRLHFTASAVDIRSAGERSQIAKVIAAAAEEGLPIVIHIGAADSMPPILNASYEMYYPALVPLGYRSLTLAVAYLGKTATTWQYCARSPTTSSKMTRPHCACCSIFLTCPLRTISRRQLMLCWNRCGEFE